MFLDRLNRRTARRLQQLRDERRGKITVTEEGLVIDKNRESHKVPWSAIERITATRTDVYIGDLIELIVAVDGGLTARAAEHDSEWQSLIEGIAENLAGSLPYPKWAVSLVAGKHFVVVFHRGHFPDL